MSAVTINLDEATPLLAQVKTVAEARGLALVGARSVASLVKGHLYGLDAQRHRHGRHFYHQAGDSVATVATPAGADVTITQLGFRQRWQGGAIYPKKKRLAIPAIDEAIGTLPREWSGLKVAYAWDAKIQALRLALVRATPVARLVLQKNGKIRKKDLNPVATGEAVFWLVRDVGQKADPTVLPYAEQMTARAVDAIQRRLARLKERRAAATNEDLAIGGGN